MTSFKPKTADALLRVLYIRLKRAHTSPLIPMQIPSEENEAKWYCKTDEEFLTFFHSKFPLPQQNSWTLLQLPTEITSKVISLLLTQRSEPDK